MTVNGEEVEVLGRYFDESGRTITEVRYYVNFKTGSTLLGDVNGDGYINGADSGIGIETAKRMWGDNYEIVVTTHLNTDHLQELLCKG